MISLRIFFNFLMSCDNFAYQPYRIPLRTALSKKLKSPLTPICIFRGPVLLFIFFVSQVNKTTETNYELGAQFTLCGRKETIKTL